MKFILNYIFLFLFDTILFSEGQEIFNNENEDNIQTNNSFDNYKKILLFFIFILILISGIGIFYYYPFNEDIIDKNLKIIKNSVDETTFLQVKSVVIEMLDNPSKKRAGLFLLDFFKRITKSERIIDESSFNKSLDELKDFLKKMD